MRDNIFYHAFEFKWNALYREYSLKKSYSDCIAESICHSE